jgi:hypothetical protein
LKHHLCRLHIVKVLFQTYRGYYQTLHIDSKTGLKYLNAHGLLPNDIESVTSLIISYQAYR